MAILPYGFVMDNENYATKPIVIVGCQRSGTTLLRTILGRHPQLLEHPDEPQFILELYERFGYVVRDVDTAVAYLIKHPYLPKTIAPATLRQAYAGMSQLSMRDFFQRYLQLWAGDALLHQRPILKHPALVYHLDLVATLFPQATIIHVVRDPRANVSSQKTRWPLYTTWESALLWKKAINQIHHWGGKAKHPILAVSYEKMLLTPEEELQRLCQQLGIQFTQAILSFEEVTTIWVPDAPPKRVKFNSIDVSHLNQWQERLSPGDIHLIEYICQEEIALWGYEPTNPDVSKTEFYRRLWYERFHYIYRSNGRYLKHTLRKLGWRLGIGLLKTPPGKHY